MSQFPNCFLLNPFFFFFRRVSLSYSNTGVPCFALWKDQKRWMSGNFSLHPKFMQRGLENSFSLFLFLSWILFWNAPTPFSISSRVHSSLSLSLSLSPLPIPTFWWTFKKEVGVHHKGEPQTMEKKENKGECLFLLCLDGVWMEEGLNNKKEGYSIQEREREGYSIEEREKRERESPSLPSPYLGA